MICTNKIVQNIARYESEMVELLVVVVVVAAWWECVVSWRRTGALFCFHVDISPPRGSFISTWISYLLRISLRSTFKRQQAKYKNSYYHCTDLVFSWLLVWGEVRKHYWLQKKSALQLKLFISSTGNRYCSRDGSNKKTNKPSSSIVTLLPFNYSSMPREISHPAT